MQLLLLCLVCAEAFILADTSTERAESEDVALLCLNEAEHENENGGPQTRDEKYLEGVKRRYSDMQAAKAEVATELDKIAKQEEAELSADLQKLTNKLDHADIEVKNRAARDLGELLERAILTDEVKKPAVDMLRWMLWEDETRPAAARALGNIGDAGGPPGVKLVELLEDDAAFTKDSNREAKLAVIDAIGKLGRNAGRKAVNGLTKILENKDSEGHDILPKCRSGGMFKSKPKSPDDESFKTKVLLGAVKAVGNIWLEDRNKTQLAPTAELLNLLTLSNSAVSKAAATTLGIIGEEGTKDMLEEKLEDELKNYCKRKKDQQKEVEYAIKAAVALLRNPAALYAEERVSESCRTVPPNEWGEITMWHCVNKDIVEVDGSVNVGEIVGGLAKMSGVPVDLFGDLGEKVVNIKYSKGKVKDTFETTKLSKTGDRLVFVDLYVSNSHHSLFSNIGGVGKIRGSVTGQVYVREADSTAAQFCLKSLGGSTKLIQKNVLSNLGWAKREGCSEVRT